MIHFNKIKREYKLGKLNRLDLTKNPIDLFKKWLHQAHMAQLTDPTAMCLATVDNYGQPYQRLVLLKNFNNTSMIFCTNLKSNKAIHLTNNLKVSLCFPWNSIDRQVIVIGNVIKLSRKKVFNYFSKRPKNNQISTWVSKQSRVLNSRKILNKRFYQFKKKYFNKKIPAPKFWGGYQVNIKSIEFWQGRTYRLHDRFIYQRFNNKWYIYRLFP